MKLKYYLRGLGIGIIITTVILTISHAMRDTSMSDEEVIARAAELGMVMEEDEGGLFDTSAADMESSEPETGAGVEAETETEPETEPETPEETENETEPETENQTGAETEAGEETAAGAENGSENTEPGETEIYTLTVVKGQVCRDICDNLAEAGIIEDSETLRKYLMERNLAEEISVGTYLVPVNATMEEIGDIIEAGSLEKQEERNR